MGSIYNFNIYNLMERVFLRRKSDAIHIMMAFKLPKGNHIFSDYSYTNKTFTTIEEADIFCKKNNLKIIYK